MCGFEFAEETQAAVPQGTESQSLVRDVVLVSALAVCAMEGLNDNCLRRGFESGSGGGEGEDQVSIGCINAILGGKSDVS